MDVFGSGKRLPGELAPVRAFVAGAVFLTVSSVGLSVLDPRILGQATDLLFSVIVGARLPAGASKEVQGGGRRGSACEGGRAPSPT